MKSSIRLLVANSYPLLMAGISEAVRDHADLELVAEAQTGTEAIELALEYQPDVALIDSQLQKVSGIEATRVIHDAHPSTRVLLLVDAVAESQVRRALQAGAAGFLPKTARGDVLVETIRRVSRGHQVGPSKLAMNLAEQFSDKNLSPREVEVLRLVAAGSPNKRIALVLDVTVDTVKAHMKSILSKLAASDRTHAVTLALRRGLIELDS